MLCGIGDDDISQEMSDKSLGLVYVSMCVSLCVGVCPCDSLVCVCGCVCLCPAVSFCSIRKSAFSYIPVVGVLHAGMTRSLYLARALSLSLSLSRALSLSRSCSLYLYVGHHFRVYVCFSTCLCMFLYVSVHVSLRVCARVCVHGCAYCGYPA